MSTPVPPDPTVGLAVGRSQAAGSHSQSGAQTSACLPVPAIRLREAAGESPTPVMHVSGGKNVPSAQETSGRLQFQGEIARGGMGAIIKGHDNLLGRDIAVKVLLQEHHGRGDFSQRFIEEAQITGQLQHPGIVPIYELGQFEDQRPFFTMKLVKGKTLSALLGDRENPAEQRGRFVGMFGQVCQTLAYAHARGVIHRDLKPSNIMVGAFGEVQVMDWGLAKVLQEGGVADEKRAKQRADVSVIRTQRSGSGSDLTIPSSYTQVGSILGTPSYLSPEQARGDVELVDERADVFGLGAILCEILSGEPPYTGRGAEATRKAQTGNLVEAWQRLDACGADEELIKLAKRCLAEEPWERPRDAGAVAKEITAYQNSVDQRLRAAEMAHAAEAARAEEAVLTAAEARARAKAQRKSLQLGLALAASVLVAAAIGALSWRRVELDRIATTSALNSRVNAALQEAMTQRGLAQGAGAGNLAPWAAAVAEAKQAEALLEPDVDPALREQVKTLLADVTFGEARALEDANVLERERQLLDRLVDIRSAKQDDPDGSATDTGYADAFSEAGIDVETKSSAEIGAALRSRPRAFVLAVVAHLDDWGQVRRHERKSAEGAAALAAIAHVLDGDAWRQKLREAIAQPEKERLAALQELSKSPELAQQGAIGLDLLGEALRESGDKVACERVLRIAQQRYPNDLWVNYDLASALANLGRREEAIRYYTAARALRPETAHALAHGLQKAGDPDEAIRIFQELTRLRPTEGRHLSCLGTALRARGRADEAAAAYDAALVNLEVEIRRAPTAAHLHNAVGIAYGGKSMWDESIASYRKAVELKPKDSTYRNNLRAALRTKVRDLQAKGQREEALAIYREVVDEDPKNVVAHVDYVGLLKEQDRLEEVIAEYREALAKDASHPVALYGLGHLLHAAGQMDETIAAFRQTVAADPGLGWAQYYLAISLREKGLLEEAIAACRKGIEIEPKKAIQHSNLASILAANNQMDEAIAVYRQASELDPANPAHYVSLADVYSSLNRHDEAISMHRKAIELEPTVANYHNNLGLALRRKGLNREAVDVSRKAIELSPKSGPFHNNLGLALRDSGQRDDAIAAFQKAIELDPKYVLAHENLVAALDKDRLADLIANHRRSLEGDSPSAAARYGLGIALRAHGQLDEAITAFQQAIEFDPKAATMYARLALTLRESGKLPEAIVEYRKAVELEPKSPPYRNNLGFALLRNSELDAAIGELRKSLQLDPKYATARVNLRDTLLAKGKKHQARAELSEAVTCFREAVQLDPKTYTAHEALAAGLKEQGQLESTIADYRRKLDHSPNGAVARYGLAILLKTAGQLDEAIAAYREAIEVDPKTLWLYSRLSTALRERGLMDEAIAAYRNAVEVDPRVAWYHNALAGTLRAGGRLDEAIAAYRKAVELDPKYVSAYSDLANALDEKGLIEEAIVFYRKAIELNPRFDLCYNNLADCLLRIGRIDEAIAASQKAVQLAPKSGKNHHTLGEGLEAKGEPDAAVAAFERALVADPGRAQAHVKLAGLLLEKGNYRQALSHFEAALAAKSPDVKLYDAACCAALLAAREKQDSTVDEKDVLGWRTQAVDWLRQELDERVKKSDQGATEEQRAAIRSLESWQQDARLASIRDSDALSKLTAGEQEACRQLWLNVAARLDKMVEAK